MPISQQAWDYDGKEFWVIKDKVQWWYRVPAEIRDEITAANPELIIDLRIAEPILFKADSEGRLGPWTRQRPL